jgi:hypothetical protein
MAATGCVRHYAPANLTLGTDWGASLRLVESGERRYAGLLSDVSPGEHWIRLTDILLCTADPWSVPHAVRGVSIGGVELRRIVTAEGAPALGFVVTAAGAVVPQGGRGGRPGTGDLGTTRHWAFSCSGRSGPDRRPSVFVAK